MQYSMLGARNSNQRFGTGFLLVSLRALESRLGEPFSSAPTGSGTGISATGSSGLGSSWSWSLVRGRLSLCSWGFSGVMLSL